MSSQTLKKRAKMGVQLMSKLDRRESSTIDEGDLSVGYIVAKFDEQLSC